MKPLAITAAILLLVTTDIFASGRQRRLSKETAPVDTAGIMSSTVWDFSGVSVIDPDSRALSEAHGDTLISESWPGRQEWLGWDGDTISYLGGESLSRIVTTPAGCLLDVRADVIDVAGNSYLSRTRQCGGETDIEIPTGGLPRGEYLLAISSPSAPLHVEKRQILIR